MSFVLHCPNCGPREVTDFSFGGELIVRPRSRPAERDLNAYIYMRRNVAGLQLEWWYHRSGCRSWFVAERDTTSNVVSWTALRETVPDEVPTGAVRSGAPETGP